ncbi:MAG: hypothetical protein II578_04285 [Bacteroidaceae bacterium]|nr:hypothetical protein [Bacteroidaceae bacterium]
MKKSMLSFAALAFAAVTSGTLVAQDNTQGYYKDLFVDGGINLTSDDKLPAAQKLELHTESFLCSPHKSQDTTAYNAADTLFQRTLIGGYVFDENGILLYPDGAPRFRCIFMNGGSAGAHGRSLGAEARNAIRDFVRAGGSYVGSCAGMFIGSKGVKGDSLVKYTANYLGIWPGYTISTGVKKNRMDLVIEKKAGILRYADFGGDHRVDSVYHNGGGFAVTGVDWPEGTEILARYDVAGRTDLTPARDIQMQPAIWGWKENEHTGRVILCGSHPEFVKDGERRDLEQSLFQYAMEGNGMPRLKGELLSGQTRQMYCTTADRTPAFTRIGDRQYHHFALQVPKDASRVTITLNPKEGWGDYDLYLMANNERFAYQDNAQYKSTESGAEQKLTIEKPRKGTLYVSVFCNTTVDTVETAWGTQYTGRLDVLNGVPYNITAVVE